MKSRRQSPCASEFHENREWSPPNPTSSSRSYASEKRELRQADLTHKLFDAFRSLSRIRPATNKGDVLNCCRKIPSLGRAGLPGSFNLPKQLRMFLLCPVQGSTVTR